MSKSGHSAESSKRGRGRGAKSAKTHEGQAASATEEVSFETALEQLEGTVARLEEGEMPLEEALELFEAGVKLSRQCSTTLEEAERRIEILVTDRGATADSVRFEFEEASDEPAEVASDDADLEG